MAISPDSSHLAIGCKTGLIQIFSITNDKLIPVVEYEWNIHCAVVYQICWLNEDKLVSCSLDGSFIQWSLDDTFKWKIQRSAHLGSVTCICFNPQRKYILYSGGVDGCIKEWQIE